MSLKTPIYLIPGLGADERIFQNIDFEHFQNENAWQPVYIKWLAPERNEKIEDYAHRLSAQITTQKPVILGVSFGGIIATEIAKQIDYSQVILVSTVKTKHEIPFLYRFLGVLRLHKILPLALFKHHNPITNCFFGMQTEAEKTLLKNILQDTDTAFLRWAIHVILLWKNETIIENVLHFHGTNDRILPICKLKTVHIKIQNGGHLMIFNQQFL